MTSLIDTADWAYAADAIADVPEVNGRLWERAQAEPDEKSVGGARLPSWRVSRPSSRRWRTLVAVLESTDWFVASLTVASGLGWAGVLMTAAIRETVVLVSGGLSAICGALVSIIFSQSLNVAGQQDPAFTPLFLALLAAGSASLYGQHRNTVDQRAASRELATTLRSHSERHADDAAHLSTAIATLTADLAASSKETGRRPGRNPWRRGRAKQRRWFVAVVKFASRSGKYVTEARMTFDPRVGRFVECVFPYTTANQPRFFMEALERLAAAR